MTSQDPAAQLVGWVAGKAVEAIVIRAVDPIASRAGRALLRQGGQAVVRSVTAHLDIIRGRT